MNLLAVSRWLKLCPLDPRWGDCLRTNSPRFVSEIQWKCNPNSLLIYGVLHFYIVSRKLMGYSCLAFLNLLNVTYLCMSLQVIVLQPIISTWSNNLITRAETAVHFAEMSIVTCTGWLYVLSHGETIECYSSNFDDHYPCNKAIDFIGFY
jgi:hypothetical protein